MKGKDCGYGEEHKENREGVGEGGGGKRRKRARKNVEAERSTVGTKGAVRKRSIDKTRRGENEAEARSAGTGVTYGLGVLEKSGGETERKED